MTLWTDRIPTLKELRDKHSLQSFSQMPKDTKLKTMRTIKAIARSQQNVKTKVANTESFNAHSGCKSDMYGIIDALATECHYNPAAIVDGMDEYLRSFQGTTYRAIQACGQDWQPHIRKLQENAETCAMWLSGGNATLELWGWRKVLRGKRKVIRPRVQFITLAFLLGDEEPEIIEVFQD